MPRATVYGKRSRAGYTNFAIFDSPQRPTTLKPTGAEEKETARLVAKITGLSLSEYADGVADGRRRSVLGERNANSVVTPVLPEKKVKRKAKKAVVVNVRAEDISEPLKGVSDTENLDVFDQEDSRDIAHIAEKATLVPARERSLTYTTQDETRPTCISDAGIAQLESVASGIFEVLPREQEPDAANADIATLDVEGDNVPTPADSVDIASVPRGLNEYSQHCSELLQLSSHRLTPFSDWADLLSTHFSLTKIAEASFGEVYRLSLLEQLPGLSASDESVFKVIALQPPVSTLPKAKKQRAAALKKAEAMSKPDDVANEVKLLQRMSSIPGFTNFRDVRIVQGRPPSLFVESFRRYNVEQKAQKKEASHFPDPGKKTTYSDDQLWAVIEMQDAGTDLERLVESSKCTSIWSVWDVFWQVVLSLAKGEEGAQFEHRDLHLGNICVRQRSTAMPPIKATAPIDVKKKLGFTALETTIIDYTISRCLLSGSPKDGEIAYHDLALDPTLFEGDSTEEYQYDIYRYMRGAVYCSNPLATIDETIAAEAALKAKRKPSWRKYHSVTNLVWLHYLLFTLLEQLLWPSARKAPPKKQKGGAAHAEWKRANDLEHKLLKVQTLLDPETGLCKNGLRSASDVVGLALTEGWLDVADVVNAGVDNSTEVEATEIEDFGAGVPASDPRLADEPTHVVINIDVMEEHGLEAAEEEARSRSRRPVRRRM
ncbi:hypothetical protein LTR56_021299 [Elasticomyces elasticus]|nr:hypothetical protein LTR56_021299 [Elasticomyces elasticus]KAK3662163.1 hypothetical protein LTR22_006928 [Elasticomyces elasticus]KAK4916141.1 hypothetical protein LTR49_015782 [Elasticomyces elasticus]KAK5767927.1 hypothetical protein LTS12_001744 [Elasticomyces elasticus]